MNLSGLDRSMRTYYRRRAGEYDEWYDRRGRYDRGPANARWHAELAELGAWVASLAAPRVLEIACGTGKWTQVLSVASKVVALDYAPEMLSACRGRMADAARSVGLVRADAYAIPLADASVDAVFCGFWMSHVFPERCDVFVREIARVLRPAGQIWVCDSSQTTEGGAIDHAAPPTGEWGGEHQRRLNDGSAHRIYKRCFSTARLYSVLRAWGPNPSVGGSDTYFVWGSVAREEGRG